MAKRRAHFFDELVEGMREDLALMAEALSDTFTDVKPFHPQPKPPTPRQQALTFLGMDQAARQRLALEVGPEAYQGMVMDHMDHLVDTAGPGAQKLLPYLLAPAGTGEMEPNRDILEAELVDMLSSAED